MKKNLCVALSLLAFNIVNAADIQPAITEFNALHFARAKPLFAALVQDEKHKNAANYYLGRIAMSGAKYEDAKTYLEESVKIQPNSADELFWLGGAYGALAQRASVFTASGLLSSYRENTEAALSIDPVHLPSLLSLYQFYVAMPSIMGGSSEKAEQMLQRIDAVSKANADVERLFLLNSKKETDKAIALAQAMVVAYPNSDQALFEAGKLLSSNKKFPEAVAALKKVTAMKVTIENYVRVQGAYFEIGQVSVRSKADIDQGISALNKVVDSELFPVNGYTNWGYWRLSQLQQLKSDVVQQKKCLELLEKTGVEKDSPLVKELKAAL